MLGKLLQAFKEQPGLRGNESNKGLRTWRPDPTRLEQVPVGDQKQMRGVPACDQGDHILTGKEEKNHSEEGDQDDKQTPNAEKERTVKGTNDESLEERRC